MVGVLFIRTSVWFNTVVLANAYPSYIIVRFFRMTKSVHRV